MSQDEKQVWVYTCPKCQATCSMDAGGPVTPALLIWQRHHREECGASVLASRGWAAYVDRLKAGQWSIYRYTLFEAISPRSKELLRELMVTGCGRLVPVYVLVRAAGPFPTMEKAFRHRDTYSDPAGLLVCPDTGVLWSEEQEP